MAEDNEFSLRFDETHPDGHEFSISVDIMPDDDIYMVGVWHNDHWNYIHLSKEQIVEIGRFITSKCGQKG